MKLLAWGSAAAVAGLITLLVVGAGAVGLVGAGPAPGAAAAGSVPAAMAGVYQQASSACPGLPWPLLAAIGTVESGNGTSSLPGVRSGANFAGAEGPMQMEPTTFAAYARPVPAGGASPPSPYDPVDAAYAAARFLCANGAAGGADPAGAVFAYNHDRSYVATVLSLAAAYSAPAPAPAVVAVRYALGQVGTPYRWGGEQPGAGFDCSGLVQAAYSAAGVALPRVAQSQFDAGPPVPPALPLQPGDLVFFGSGLRAVTHVGIVVGAAGEMVDAPHTGARVRVEPFPTLPGAAWGADYYLGATRPG